MPPRQSSASDIKGEGALDEGRAAEQEGRGNPDAKARMVATVLESTIELYQAHNGAACYQARQWQHSPVDHANHNW